MGVCYDDEASNGSPTTTTTLATRSTELSTRLIDGMVWFGLVQGAATTALTTQHNTTQRNVTCYPTTTQSPRSALFIRQLPRNRWPLEARCLLKEPIPQLVEYLRRSLAPREPWQEEEELIPVAMVMALQ